MADNKKNMNDQNQNQNTGKQGQGLGQGQGGQSGQMGTEKRDDSNLQRDVERERDTTGQKYGGAPGQQTGINEGKMARDTTDEDDSSQRKQGLGQRSDDKNLGGKSGPGSQER